MRPECPGLQVCLECLGLLACPECLGLLVRPECLECPGLPERPECLGLQVCSECPGLPERPECPGLLVCPECLGLLVCPECLECGGLADSGVRRQGEGDQRGLVGPWGLAGWEWRECWECRARSQCLRLLEGLEYLSLLVCLECHECWERPSLLVRPNLESLKGSGLALRMGLMQSLRQVVDACPQSMSLLHTTAPACSLVVLGQAR